MGIADVRKALEENAAGKATFQNVTLGYADGGKQQVLRFNYRLNLSDEKFFPFEEKFPGSDNPNHHASTVVQRIAAEFDEKSQQGT